MSLSMNVRRPQKAKKKHLNKKKTALMFKKHWKLNVVGYNGSTSSWEGRCRRVKVQGPSLSTYRVQSSLEY